MNKSKHFLNIKTFSDDVENEKNFFDAVYRVGVSMRDAAEAVIAETHFENKNFVLTENSMERVAEIIDQFYDDENMPAIEHFGLLFISQEDGEQITAASYAIPSEKGLLIGADITLINKDCAKLYRPDKGWTDLTNDEYGQQVIDFYKLNDGEQAFIASAIANGHNMDEAREYLERSGALPDLCVMLRDAGVDAFPSEAEVYDDIQEDETVAASVAVPERAEAVLLSPDGISFDIFEYDDENSEPGYLVGLAHVKRCATLNEVKRYIIGEYSN